MKQYKNYILLIAIMLGSVSCESYLDKKPDVGGVSEAAVFNDFQSVRGYLDRVYAALNDYLFYYAQGNAYGGYITGEMSDEGANPGKLIQGAAPKMATVLNSGQWQANQCDGTAEIGWNDNNNFNDQNLVIAKSFDAIRICNRVLDEVPVMTKLTQDQVNQLTGQAYFFRGWFYFEVIRRIGGFVPMDRVFDSNDSGDTPRLSYSESNDYIIKDMDQAIDLLPNKWEDVQTGRPTKSSAYAVKEMAELYAASPLMRNGIDKTDQYTDYDPDLVKLAAEYARDCLVYIYYTNIGNCDQTMMSGDQYANIFYYPNGTFVSQESLWYRNKVGVNRESDCTTVWQNSTMAGRPGFNGCPNFSLSQNIINKFETINGYSCQLTASGWQCDDPNFNSEMPYQNRDPRLYSDVLLPGERFGTLTSTFKVTDTLAYPGHNDSKGKDEDVNAFYLATWESGRDANFQGTAGNGSVLTRYLVKKYQWPSSVTGTNSQTAGGGPGYKDFSFNAILIRTTQVWLDYAEAMNEAYGPNVKPAGYDWTAVEAINMVRARVGMCDVRSEYTGSKETFRNKIRDERAVELMCENHRWFDIRRWMIAEQLFSSPTPIYGATVGIKQGYTSLDPYTIPPGITVADRANAKYGQGLSYSLSIVGQEVRIFHRQHYWYPLRKDEINRYPKLKQNPGWN